MASDLNGQEPQKPSKAKDKRVSFLDRMIQQAIGDNRQLGRESDPARTRYPELWRWLTLTDCPGNRVKAPATLMIRMGPEGALISLNDRDLGAAIDLCCPHLIDVLDACEQALTSDNVAIRTNSKKDPKIRKRKQM